MGNKRYKSYYLGVSGHGLDRMSVRSAFLRIGDFERRVSKDSVEIIEENGHLGCGFIPKSLLVEVIGNSKAVTKISDVADRVFVIQVRATKPLHDDVVLNITACFPSKPNQHMGRHMNEDLKDPTANQLKALKPPCREVLRVLESKGVDRVVLRQCEFSPHWSPAIVHVSIASSLNCLSTHPRHGRF